MAETTNQNIDELEAMRRQMGELRATLDRQEIVNERLMRKVMAGKSGYIRRMRNMQLFLVLPFIVIIFLVQKYQLGTSWALYVATVLMSAVSVAFETYVNRMSESDYSEMPLLELIKALKRRRKQRRLQVYVGLPIATLWLIWYSWELSGIKGDYPFAISVLIGGIAGGWIGISIMRRMQRIDADAIDDIQELNEKN